MHIEPLNLAEARAAIQPAPVRKRMFDAAQYNRLTADFLIDARRIDDDLRIAGKRLRDRSRNLAKNNKVAAKFIALVKKNVLGCDGIKFQSKVMMQRTRAGKSRPNEPVNTAIQDAFLDWGKRQNASLDQELSWINLQHLILETVVIDGECLIRKVQRPDLKYGFALQVLDTDQLYTEKNDPSIGIINGVRRDADGRRVSYFLYDRHPDLPGAKVLEVSADQILHIFVHHFVGQTRGIPWMAPVMVDIHRGDQYDKAELVAAQIAANQMGFWRQELAKEDIKDGSFNGDSASAGQTSGGMPVMTEMGSFTVGGPNDSITMFKPEHPVAAFEPFKRTCLQGVSAGLDVAYMSLTGDVGSANYSSSRTGLLDERATWEMVQRWFVESLCAPVHSDGWLPQAFLRDPLRTLLPGSDYRAYDKAEWHPRSFPWVDPEKDAKAIALKIQNGLSTLTRELNAQGYDLEETLLELATERNRIKELGLKVGIDEKGAADTASDDMSDGAGEVKKKPDANA